MRRYIVKIMVLAALLPAYVMAQCPAPTQLTTSNVAGSTALVTWMAGNANSFDVEYKSTAASTWDTAVLGTSNAYYYLSGLSINTTYQVRVRSNCTGSSSSWVTASFRTNNCLGSGDVTIGTGTNTSYQIPLNNFYRYTYTQQIFTAAELGGRQQTITSVAFQYAYSTASSVKTNCTIYLGHTSQSYFSSTSNYVPLTALTMVYTGPMNCSSGWNTFNFATPFNYNGTDNLVLAVDDNSNNYNGSSYVFNYTSTTSNQCIYYYSDSYNPDPSNPTLVSASSSTSTMRNNVIFGMCNSTLPANPQPVVSVIDVTPNAVELAWAPLGNETRWKVDYSTNRINWTSVGTLTSRSHRFNGLQSSTQYYFRVGSIYPTDTSYTTVSVTTECSLMSFPTVENFDQLPTGSNSPLTLCWTKNSNYSTGYPYVSNTSYSSSTPNCLYMYAYSSYHTGIVSPKSPEPLNRLQVSFTAYKNNTSYSHDVMIGAMSDPDDFTTFEPIDTAEMGTNTGYYHFTIPLSSYTGNARYIGIFACTYGNSYSYPYIDDIEIDYYATCSRATNVRTSSNSPTSAICTWQPGRNGVPDHYIVSYTPASTINWQTDTTHSPYKVLTNLTAGETYYISITPVCAGNDTSYAVFDTILTPSCMTQPDTIGNGTTASINVPIETDVDWGYTQQIYDSVDLGGPNTFSAIAFEYKGAVALTAKTNCTIYMANAPNSTFVSNTNTTLVPDSLFTVVYTGPLNCNTGWNTFIFDTTFQYDGHSNLVIAIDDNSGASANGTANFATHATTGNKSAVIGAFIDIDPVSPIIPPTAYAYRNNIMLFYCDTSATCASPTASSVDVTDNTIRIAWAPGLRETSWIIERGSSPNGPWTYVTTTTQQNYLFTNLTASTRYYFRVGAICTNDTMYSIVSDSTDCAYIVNFPHTESFEPYTATQALNSTIGTCWTRKNSNVNATSIMPYVYTGTASQGTKSLYFSTTSSQYALLATPPMGEPVSNLMITFDYYRSSSSYDCKMAIGVMNDPTDITSFVGIDTIWGSYGMWETFTIPFDSYSGTGKYIALVSIRNEYSMFYLDNIIIDTIPACPKPTRPAISNLTSNSAYASWLTGVVGNDITDYFIVEIKPTSQSTWVVDTTSNQYYFFSNLIANTRYDFRVKAVCKCGDTSDYATFQFTTTNCLTGGNANIENSTTYVYYLPIVNTQAYSYTQQLYTNAELGGPKNITAVEFFYESQTPMTAKDSCTIYLGHTTKTSFTSGSDYESFNNLVPVYTGPLNATSFGWNRFVFDVPFYYNGFENLIIAIDDNSGATQGNYSFYVASVPNKAIYFYSSTDVNPASPTSTGYLYSYRNSIRFVSPCNNSASCVPPNVRIMGNTSNSVDLIWVPGNTDSVWVVLYKTRRDSIWHVADTVRTTQYTLGNLSAISTYDIRVMSLCGGDSAYAQLSTQTGCGAVSVYPYQEDFESYSASSSPTAYYVTNTLPNCWTFYSSGTNTHARRNDYCPRVYGSTNSSYLPNTSGKALILTASNYYSTTSTYNYQTVGAYQYAIMPEFADSLPRLTVSFKYRMNYTNTTTNYGMLDFGYVVNDTNFTTIESYPATTTAQTVFMDLSEDSTIHHVPGARLAFRCRAVYNYASYIIYGIDNVEIGWAPTCIKPNNLGDASIDSITTRLYWSDATTLSTTLGYEVTWGEFGFDPDTVTVNYATTTDTFLLVNNLQSNTIYQFRVRALCGIDGDSKWSNAHTFRVAQVPASMPYNCTFESTGSTNNGWTIVGPTYGNNTWTVGTAVANNSNRSMYVSNTGGLLNDYANNMPTVSWAYRDIYVPVNAGNNFNLKFDWRCDGENSRDYMAVFFGGVATVEGNSTGTLTPPANATFVGRFNGNSTSFQRHTYQLPQLSDTVIRIYFAWVNDGNAQGNNPPAAIDNVSVKLDCPEPNRLRITNITESSAKVTWSRTTGSYHWLLEYRPDGLTQWTTIALNDTTYTLTGLTPSMTYMVRVRCLCTVIDTSDYSDSVRFNTLCGQVRSFPYVETFDNYGTSSSAYPTCWSYTGNATRPNCSASAFSSSPASLYFNTTANTQAIAVAPKMRVFNPYELEVSLRAYAPSTTSYLVVGLMSDSSSTMSFIGVDTVRVTAANTWINYVCDLSSYTGVGQFVGFKVGGAAASTFYIDNITIDYHGGNCADPTNLATTFGTNDMTCTWNEVGNYEFQYCILGDTVWSNTHILNNTNNYHKTGLVDSTTYIWRIRTICPDSAGYSHWISDTITTFALPCNPVTNILTSNITDTSVMLKWDADSNQNAWEVHCFDNEAGVDTIYTVYTNPCVLEGLITGLAYQFTVRSLCTSGLNGGWSDTIEAIVAFCKPVKNVHIIPLSSSAVNITWDITDPDQNIWEVEYGLRGFYEGDGTGTTVLTATNSYTLTGLNFTTTYDVFVRARCGNGYYSIWTERKRFALAGIDQPDDDDASLTLYPNPASSEVSVIVNAEPGEYRIDVVDMKGRIVNTQAMTLATNNGSITIDISTLARGTYFVKISNGDFKVVRKLIAQ